MARLMIQRFLISIVLGLIVGIGINEFTFIYLKSDAGRGPQRIELLIPDGTADRIAKGEPNPAIPTNMVFVAGDTLVLKNLDVVDHRLGPLFIPSGTSAILTLNDANNFAYQCSFQSSKVFGLNVQEPVTSATRIYGILIAGLPLGVMLGMYSLVIWPVKINQKAS
ncbi:MAG: hypothetical protein NTW32_25605 [Chloroflexi bacterium]|nr:hypothetical protein [Chloroflexota bacterium]